MSLFYKLKTDLTDARKALITNKTEENMAKASILRLLVSEFDSKGNETPDQSDEVVNEKIREYIRSNELIKDNNVEGSEKYIKADIENVILESYLPKQLSDSDLEREINVIIEENSLDSIKGMGVVKKELERKFDNQYDKKHAGDVGKRILTNL